MLMESHKEHSTTFVPRMLKWDEILSDESWKFESIMEPLPIQPSRSSIESILQFSDGSVNLKFLRSSSSNPESFCRRLSTSRPSTSKTREGDEQLYETEEVSEQHGKFRGVDFTQTIPKVYYESSFTGSPTPSEMKAPSHKRKDSIGTIKSVDKFIPDLKKINKWWVSP